VARYGTLPRQWWRQDRFRRDLDDDQRLALFYLRSTPHALSIPGAVVSGLAAHAEEIGWPVKRFATAVEALIARGWCKADLDSRLIWLPDMVDDDPPRNPNTVRSWGRVWPEVPECSLKVEIWTALQQFRERFEQLSPEQFDELFPQRLGQRFAPPGSGPEHGPEPVVAATPSPVNGSLRGDPEGAAEGDGAGSTLRGDLQEMDAVAPRPARKPRANPSFDFAAVYDSYPRKAGRKPGLDAARKRIRTEDDFQALKTAVTRMAELWRGVSADEMRFCPHFATFVNHERWRDEELPRPRDASAAPAEVPDWKRRRDEDLARLPAGVRWVEEPPSARLDPGDALRELQGANETER
jgi:hypothetical protein